MSGMVVTAVADVTMRMSSAFRKATESARDLGDAFDLLATPYERHARRERNRALLRSSHAHRSRRQLRRRHSGRILVRTPSRMDRP